jgi:hypothetical protein
VEELRKLRNEELQNLYSSLIIRVMINQEVDGQAT